MQIVIPHISNFWLLVMCLCTCKLPCLHVTRTDYILHQGLNTYKSLCLYNCPGCLPVQELKVPQLPYVCMYYCGFTFMLAYVSLML